MKHIIVLLVLVCLSLAGVFAQDSEAMLTSFPDTYLESFSDVSNGSTFSYSEAEARVFAHFAGASYCLKFPEKTALENWSCAACKATGLKATDITRFIIPVTKTMGYVSYIPDKKLIVLTFTGSSNFQNWVSDLEFIKVNYPGCPSSAPCQVHSGFYLTYRAARPTVVGILTKLLTKYPGSFLSITGHSLGAALAVHAIQDLQNDLPFQVTTISGITFVENGNEAYDDVKSPLSAAQVRLLGGSVTSGVRFSLGYPMFVYGQPRVGDKAWSEWFLKTVGTNHVYRLTAHRDPVPHLPPLSFGFQHASVEVFYDTPSAYVTCSTTNGEDPNCSDKYKMDIVLTDHALYAGQNMAVQASEC